MSGGVTIPLGANERNRWSTNLRSATPPSPPPPFSRLCPRRPRYLPYPGCQVVAVQHNRANRGPTRALAFSTNEGVSRCGERVQVFACSRQPVNHHACSQTSFRFRFHQISGEPPPPPPPQLCVRVDVPVCVRLLFQALLRFEGCSLPLPPSKETPTDLTRRCAQNEIVFADLPPVVCCRLWWGS